MARAAAARPLPLIPGESPDGTVGTARRWLATYDELLRFVDRALVEPAPDDALRASLLRKRREFRRRYVFWEGQLRQARLARSQEL